MAYDPYGANSKKTDKKGGKFLAFDWKDAKPKFHSIKKAGDFALDIIPYKIATKYHPDIKNGAEIGDEVYALDYWVHKYVGPGQVTVVCPRETFGKKCPICEKMEENMREFGPKSKEFTGLKPKHRVLYNVIDPNAGNNEVMLFEESFALFEQELIKASKVKGERKGVGHIKFANLSEGYSVFFNVERASFEKAEFNKYSNFDFEKKEQPHKKSMVNSSLALDEYLNILPYDKLEEFLDGGSDDEDEDEAPAKKPAKASRVDDDEGDEPPAKPAKRARVEEDDEEEDRPPKKEESRKKTSQPSEDDDDNGDDDEKCPAGMKFGKDYSDTNAACDDCQLWKACWKATQAK